METERSLENRAMDTIRRHRMLEGGETVVVSVSGGPDSVALLLLLSDLRSPFDLRLFVFHLDHMFRGEESAADAEYVRSLAEGLGIGARVVSRDVPALVRGSGRSPQDVARSVRRELLDGYADEVGATRVAVGHTADDQVETFLMRALQGAGLTGLAGIPPVSGRVIRPLIEVWRSEVLEFCRVKGATPREDPSNADDRYARNRVRNRLVPFLTAEFGDGSKEVIAREVASLALDREFLERLTDDAYAQTARASGGEVTLDIERLLALPPALESGVLRRAWTELMPEEPNLLAAHVRDVREKVARGATGARLDLPRATEVERVYGELVFRSKGPAPPDVSAVLQQSGRVEVRGAALVLEAEMVDREEVSFGADPTVEYVRPDTAFPLEVRTVRDGDRFHPLGSSGGKKLQDFFTDEKVPRAERARALVVLSGGEIVWVVGRRLDDRFKLREGDARALRLIARRQREYDVDVAGGEEGRDA